MSVRKRKRNGRVEGWEYDFENRGVRYHKVGFATARAAQDAEWAKRREVGATAEHSGKLLFREAVERYLEERIAGTAWEPSVRPALRRAVATLGGVPLPAVTPAHVLEHKARLLREPRAEGKPPLAKAAVNRHLSMISALYGWAQSLELVPPGYNPALRRVVPRESETWRPWVILTAEQREALWAALPPASRVKAQLLFHLGVRLGVVLRLRWEAIDWSNDLVTYESKGKRGVIPLNQTARNLLLAVWEEQGRPLAGPVWARVALQTLRRHWQAARCKVGLPGLRRHDLRVTFARELATRGADLRTIQGALGHATVAMTTRYIPDDLQARRAAVRLLDLGNSV